MAKTTDELFAEATEADYETAEPVTLAASDTEEEFQFRIDEHLRTIAIPEKGVVAGVEGDLNVNIARFTMTRYYHGRDLSKLNIRINYRNANGQVNYYTVSDATISGDSIVFSWEYAADVTQYKGNVQFVVYLFSATSAVLKQKFFTTLGTLEVLEGLEVDSSIPVSEQTDILLHLKKDLSAYAEEVKKSLPADYTAMTEQVNSLKEDLINVVGNKFCDDYSTVYGFENGIFENGYYRVSGICTQNYGLISLKIGKYSDVKNKVIAITLKDNTEIQKIPYFRVSINTWNNIYKDLLVSTNPMLFNIGEFDEANEIDDVLLIYGYNGIQNTQYDISIAVKMFDNEIGYLSNFFGKYKPSDLESLFNEIINARVSFNDINYNTLGESIRSVTNLNHRDSVKGIELARNVQNLVGVLVPVELDIKTGFWYRTGSNDMQTYVNSNATEVNVNFGETYTVSLATIGGVMRGLIFLDGERNTVSEYYVGESVTVECEKIDVPYGASIMCISSSKTNPISVKKYSYSEKDKTDIENIDKWMMFYEDNYVKRISDIARLNAKDWKDFDNGYITLCFDDTNSEIGYFVKTTNSKNVPCCIAPIPSRINNVVQTTESGTTVKEVLQNAVLHGGEVLVHGDIVLTSENENDKEVLFKIFVENKKILYDAGFDVNGIITTGGSGYDTFNPDITIPYLYSHYRYSDLYGGSDEKINYYHPRIWADLANHTTMETIKYQIDEAVANKQWLVYFAHSTSELPLESLKEIIDYSISKGAEIVTYADMYKKFHN